MKNLVLLFSLLVIASCSVSEPSGIPIIVDADTNNELDDQHALAYLFFNEDIFDIKGITTNATFNGGGIEEHYKEAQRVMELCDVWEKYPLLVGADSDFETIFPTLQSENFDGHEAVDFIIGKALEQKNQKLVLVPIGKLTNIALALEKEPTIKDKVRIVWLGSNYPRPGEYNQVNDIAALNYILNQEVEFEMVMVRYGEASGSDAVRVTPDDVMANLAGKGPQVNPVEGRHGGHFTNFGDYSVNLFSGIDLHGTPPGRALFDLVALAIVKTPAWGEKKMIPAPLLVDNAWQERPDNSHKIAIWENFDKQSIIDDFYEGIHKASQ